MSCGVLCMYKDGTYQPRCLIETMSEMTLRGPTSSLTHNRTVECSHQYLGMRCKLYAVVSESVVISGKHHYIPRVHNPLLYAQQPA